MKLLKKQIMINADCLKEKKFDSVPDFVRWALQVNGVDYDRFKEQMTAINEKFAYQPDLSKFKEAYKSLFVGDSRASNLEFLPNEFAVKYETPLFNEKLATYKVAAQKSINQQSMVLNLAEKITMTDGREKEDLTTLHLSDNHLTMEYKYNADLGRNFDKKTFSYNNYERDQINYEFGFDEANQITKYGYYRCTSESANWNRSQMKDLLKTNQETGLTK